MNFKGERRVGRDRERRRAEAKGDERRGAQQRQTQKRIVILLRQILVFPPADTSKSSSSSSMIERRVGERKREGEERVSNVHRQQRQIVAFRFLHIAFRLKGTVTFLKS